MDKLLSCKINNIYEFIKVYGEKYGVECESISTDWFNRYKIEDIEIVTIDSSDHLFSHTGYSSVSIVWKNKTLALYEKYKFVTEGNIITSNQTSINLYFIDRPVDLYRYCDLSIFDTWCEITDYENTTVGDYFKSNIKSANKCM